MSKSVTRVVQQRIFPTCLRMPLASLCCGRPHEDRSSSAPICAPDNMTSPFPQATFLSIDPILYTNLLHRCSDFCAALWIHCTQFSRSSSSSNVSAPSPDEASLPLGSSFRLPLQRMLLSICFCSVLPNCSHQPTSRTV